MGYDGAQVTAFLDHIGIAEEQIQWIVQNLNNPNYSNLLKIK